MKVTRAYMSVAIPAGALLVSPAAGLIVAALVAVLVILRWGN